MGNFWGVLKSALQTIKCSLFAQAKLIVQLNERVGGFLDHISCCWHNITFVPIISKNPSQQLSKNVQKLRPRACPT